MDTFSTSQVAKRFGVSDQTVKNWSAEFAQYLSPTATPDAGKRRGFTAEDVATLALVHELVGRGRDTAAAHAALQAGQRGAVNALTVTNAADSLIAVQHERDMLQGALMEIRTQLEKAELRHAADEQEIIDLQRKLARLEVKIELYESGELKPKA